MGGRFSYEEVENNSGCGRGDAGSHVDRWQCLRALPGGTREEVTVDYVHRAIGV